VPKLIIITGPTGSGKTALAIAIASQLKAQIINCDSRQIYAELGVAVAKPSLQELSEVPHYFVGTHSIYDAPVSAGEFARLALKKINSLVNNEFIVLCGGTGFYITALLNGFDIRNTEKQGQIRTQVDDIYKEGGIEAVIKELQNSHVDIDESMVQNPARLKRVLEIALQGHVKEDIIPFQYPFKIFSTQVPRPQLYDQINKRVDSMVKMGLVSEAKELHGSLPEGIKTVGYNELFEHFNGLCTQEFAIDKVKQHSRNYAKRQMTYIRHQFSQVVFVSPNEGKDVIFADIKKWE
jgi:tRNA dimethylallyltransferase